MSLVRLTGATFTATPRDWTGSSFVHAIATTATTTTRMGRRDLHEEGSSTAMIIWNHIGWDRKPYRSLVRGCAQATRARTSRVRSAAELRPARAAALHGRLRSPD